MPEGTTFCYRPICSTPDCREPAQFKIAAPWSDGTGRELKNYGLACARHKADQLDRARRHRDALKVTDGETVGPVALFRLAPGRRDSELAQVEEGT
jgi:hypothetical protein